jgi:antitoxin MazE
MADSYLVPNIQMQKTGAWLLIFAYFSARFWSGALVRAVECAEVAVVATMWARLRGAVVVRAKLVKIGNSRGIRLAKPLLEVAGLADEVEIEAAPGVLTIRPSAHPRAGWAEAAASFEPEGLLDEMSATRFDDEEWSWWLRNAPQEVTSSLSRWIQREDLKLGRPGLVS